MTIRKLYDQLQTASVPIEQKILENECCSVSVLGLSNGMMLREQKLEENSKMLVLDGTVRYIELENKVTLQKFDELEIPANVTHYIIANDDSICLLTSERDPR